MGCMGAYVAICMRTRIAIHIYAIRYSFQYNMY